MATPIQYTNDAICQKFFAFRNAMGLERLINTELRHREKVIRDCCKAAQRQFVKLDNHIAGWIRVTKDPLSLAICDSWRQFDFNSEGALREIRILEDLFRAFCRRHYIRFVPEQDAGAGNRNQDAIVKKKERPSQSSAPSSSASDSDDADNLPDANQMEKAINLMDSEEGLGLRDAVKQVKKKPSRGDLGSK